MNMTSNNFKNDIDLEETLRTLLSFNDEEEKLDFEIDKINLSIISKVDTLMKKNKMTKKDLADKLGTSKSYITQLFNGDKVINLKILAKLQLIFDISFNLSIEENNKYNDLGYFEMYGLKTSSFNFNENINTNEWLFSDKIIPFKSKDIKLCKI